MPQTLEELSDQIEHAFYDIPLATIQTLCCSVQRRCSECTLAEGGHFEVHRYGSGSSIRACHAAGLGSIPDRDKFLG